MDDGKLSAATNLPDDLVVEILSRLPVRPLRRCKCVSRAWRDLISHSHHRRRLAQTVSGFFYHLHVDASCPPIVPYWRFTASSPPPHPQGSPPPAAVDHAFAFLPSTSYATTDTELLDSSDYLQGKRQTRLAALAFDPAVSSTRFHVLQLVEKDCFSFPLLSQNRFVVEAVEIYSSETKSWVVCDCSEWRLGFQVTCTGQQGTYHDGSLHFALDDGAVMSVDTKGEAW
ncbi:uncharacterized protein LOC112895731 [Panicum hallii]|uniref:uncharacterized protein LOC112895731 n=1 Tax=Panicum hallii TaxID=206008 RepID=UPI000DF4ED72|nr:uncharacterized protein LOC112895731 [Panicum hallii]